MANELREKQRVRFNANAAWLQERNGGEFATVTRISRDCVHLRLDNGKLVGPLHHEYLKAVSKFVEGDRVRTRHGYYHGKRGVVSVSDEVSLVRVVFDGHATSDVVCIHESHLEFAEPEAIFKIHDWVLIGGKRKGQVSEVRVFLDETYVYAVRVSTNEMHRGVKEKDLTATTAPEPEPVPTPVFKRPVFAFSEGQRVVHKSINEVGVVENRMWRSSGASYNVRFADRPGHNISEALLDKYWFEVGDRVWDSEGGVGNVVSHEGTVVTVAYTPSTGVVKAWDEWAVTPWDVPAQPTPDTLLIAEFNKTKQDLANAAKSRDEWKTLSEENAARRKEYSDDNKRLQEEVSLLKEQVAILKPIVITGMPVKLDYNTPMSNSNLSSIALQLNTGAGVIDISTKTINSADIKAIRDLYHAQVKRGGMITVTITAR